jgi:adenylate cyclase
VSSDLRKVLLALAIAVVSVLLTLLLSQVPLVDRWENQIRDVLFRDFQARQSVDEAVIVTIDQNSLDYFQRDGTLWPWPRTFYGAAVEYLSYCEARAIAFDIILSSPDIDRLNERADYADAFFAEQMKRSGRVILAAQMEDSSRQEIMAIADSFNLSVKYQLPEALVRNYPRATLPIMTFQQGMAYPGVVNFFNDSDGICRRLPLVFAYQNRIYPYMAVAAVLLYENIDTVAFNPAQSTLILGNHRVPLEPTGFYPVCWYGPSGDGASFRYVSFAQLIRSYIQWKGGQQPLIPPEVFRDKAVFVGATAAGLLDLKPTPFSTLAPFPGVEIYANVFANIIRDEYLNFLALEWWIPAMLVLLFLLGWAWQKLRLWQSIAMTLLMLAVPLFLAVLCFRSYRLFIPGVSSELAIVLSLISVLLINYLTEGREKRQVKKVFIRYLHPAVVESLTRNPEKLEMGGKMIEATVLFTDLQGFTSISELFEPPEIVQFLNNYFEKVEKIIFNNDGMLDKYTGDGLMAIFGAPLENPDHARQACQAALGFQSLSALKIETSAREIPLITRVGINSGKLVVGNIGSSQRMDYTAIGDTVNLAARLEGVNKIYGTQNIISEMTYKAIENEFVCRELDFIRVKGREKPLRIFTVVGVQKNPDPVLAELLEQHQQALALYRAKDYPAAAAAFKALFEKHSEDHLAHLFYQRCEQLKTEPELVDDQGIYNIKVK